jgi:hypothetical protein
MDETALRRLIGEAIAATGTTAPRIVADWLLEHRREPIRGLLAAYVFAMFGWRPRPDQPARPPAPAEPEALF